MVTSTTDDSCKHHLITVVKVNVGRNLFFW